MKKPFLTLIDIQPRIAELRFAEPVNWSLREEEVWTILGPNGAGKTVLANLISGKLAPHPGGEIQYHCSTNDFKVWRDVEILAFDSVYGLADFRNSYYQQRWHGSGNEEMPLVRDLFQADGDPHLLGLFGVDRLLDKKINYLSSGELHKFLITKALLNEPKLLIIDNPYIGLDPASREMLREALRNLNRYSRTRLIFLLSDPSDIPDFVTDILPVEGRKVLPPVKPSFVTVSHTPESPREFPGHPQGSENIVEMNDIRIRYGEKIILEHINWRIRRGEKWVLSGPNGSGKSTLLSLINADHPQAYANDIVLFGHKRGAGQSIWEIKKRIGYVSPEMHTHYYQHIPALDVVGSGLFDTIGTVHRCDREQTARSVRWIEKFGIAHLTDRSFMKLSSGEQRLVLLARAFVKEPELLILDEPLHGLDADNKVKVLNLIEGYAQRPEVTLIYVTHYTREIPPCVTHRFVPGKP